MPKSAIIYIRQSSNKEDRRTTSPQVQSEACRALVQDCGDVQELLDLDKSGKSVALRPGFQQILDRIATNPPDVIAVYDQSRTFRNTSEALQFFALMERMPKIEVRFRMGSFERSPVGEFSYTTLAAAHTMERKMVSAKRKAGVHYDMQRGVWVGKVPVGYKLYRQGQEKRLELDPEWSDKVRSIFELYATGEWSLGALARHLNTSGLVPPTFRTVWTGPSLGKFLRNVTYHGQTYTEDRTGRKGELIDATWPAIVDDALWTACERVARSHDRAGGRVGFGYRKAISYVFQNMLRCSCGDRMHANSGGGKYRYYTCRNKYESDPCPQLSVREDALLPWGRAVFAALDPDAAQGGFGAALAAQTGRKVRRSSEGLDTLNKRLERAKAAYLAELMTLDELKAEQDRIDALKAEILASQRAPETTALDRELTGSLALWDAAEGKPAIRRRLLAALFDELDIKDGRIVGYRPRADHALYVTHRMRSAFGEALAERIA